MSKEPLLVSYDAVKDLLTVNGKVFDGDLFRTFEWSTPAGYWMRIEARAGDDVICIYRKSESEICREARGR